MFLQELTDQAAEDMEHDDRWLAVQQIVNSPLFRKSTRLSRLLCYLSEHTLRERQGKLTEHQIAANVFDRSTFEPSVDTIVRSHMVRLRQKLEQYADDNQSAPDIRVTIPKGEYSVRFERAFTSLPVPVQIQHPHEIPTVSSDVPSKPTRWLIYLSYALAATAAILLVSLLAIIRHSSNQSKNRVAPSHPLWSIFFNKGEKTTFVAADSGLVLLNRLTSKEPSLSEYLAHDFHHELAGLPMQRSIEVLNLADRRYTSVVDMNMVRHLSELSATYSGQLDVKYARDIQINDLKGNDVILSGARGANPWIALYEANMNFVVARDPILHISKFINRRPQKNETAEYSATPADAGLNVLGLLAFLPNLDRKGNVLIVEGIGSMAGTEAVSDLLFNDEKLLPFLKEVSKPDGTLAHFELIVQSRSINGSAGPFRPLAYRIYP